MSTHISVSHQPLLSFTSSRASQFPLPFSQRFHFSGPSTSQTLLPRTLTLTVAKLSFLPHPETSDGFLSDLLDRAEGLFYTLADAAVSNPDTPKPNDDWFSGITTYMETVLKVLNDGLSHVHTPYAYGFAIILLTVIVKAATFPLSKKQVESAMAMKSLTPQIKAIHERYAGDQERIQLEIARIYKLAGINPLAGCLPTLATIPIWIGLYRALSNVANEGLLTEGFFWIPSLAGPTTIAARQSGSGISWLFPFVDGQPPLGWSDTFAYLVLPVLLVVSQYISVQIMQASQPSSDDPNVKTSQAITKFLPLMIGYFALSVPSGLSLYWLTNNILSTAQQMWLQKLGGAKNPVEKISQETINDEKVEIKKPLLEMKSIPIEEALPSTGVRPGERFRKLKEEGERRKRQKEEEERRAEEVVENAVSMVYKEEKKPKLDRGENGHLVVLSVEEDRKDITANTVNGNASGEASRGQESASIPVEDTSGHADTNATGVMDNQVTERIPEKEVAEIASGATSTENRSHEEDQFGQN